tara:strand:- start:37 stop:276 length:240 start_codon:yes stop_codon:yes gene_type:complete
MYLIKKTEKNYLKKKYTFNYKMKGKARNIKRKNITGEKKNKRKFEHNIETYDKKIPVDQPQYIFEGYKNQKKYLKKLKK